MAPVLEVTQSCRSSETHSARRLAPALSAVNEQATVTRRFGITLVACERLAAESLLIALGHFPKTENPEVRTLARSRSWENEGSPKSEGRVNRQHCDRKKPVYSRLLHLSKLNQDVQASDPHLCFGRHNSTGSQDSQGETRKNRTSAARSSRSSATLPFSGAFSNESNFGGTYSNQSTDSQSTFGGIASQDSQRSKRHIFLNDSSQALPNAIPEEYGRTEIHAFVYKGTKKVVKSKESFDPKDSPGDTKRMFGSVDSSSKFISSSKRSTKTVSSRNSTETFNKSISFVSQKSTKSTNSTETSNVQGPQVAKIGFWTVSEAFVDEFNLPKGAEDIMSHAVIYLYDPADERTIGDLQSRFIEMQIMHRNTSFRPLQLLVEWHRTAETNTIQSGSELEAIPGSPLHATDSEWGNDCTISSPMESSGPSQLRQQYIDKYNLDGFRILTWQSKGKSSVVEGFFDDICSTMYQRFERIEQDCKVEPKRSSILNRISTALRRNTTGDPATASGPRGSFLALLGQLKSSPSSKASGSTKSFESSVESRRRPRHCLPCCAKVPTEESDDSWSDGD